MAQAGSASSESIYLGTDVRCVRHLYSHTGVLHSTSSWQHLLACAEWCPDTQVDFNFTCERQLRRIDTATELSDFNKALLNCCSNQAAGGEHQCISCRCRKQRQSCQPRSFKLRSAQCIWHAPCHKQLAGNQKIKELLKRFFCEKIQVQN